MSASSYLIQGLMGFDPTQIDPTTGRLRVDVNEQQPLPNLPFVPDTPARTSLKYTPPQVDIPSMSMPAQEALSQRMGNYPRFNPGFGNRLVASLAAGSEGYDRGPLAGLRTGQAYIQAPFQEKVERFQSENVPAMYRAGVESENFKRALERAKLQGEIGDKSMKNQVDVENANSRILQEESRRINARTASQQANIRNFIANQPDQTFRETTGGSVPNEIVGFNKKGKEVNRTGVSGYGKWRSLDELKELMSHRYNELGKMLRDIPQRDVFAAIDNALRVEGLRNPGLYGKFFGKDGYILSPDQLKKFSGDDAEAIRRLMDAAVKKALEGVTKSKNLQKGVVDPNQTRKLPGGATILNPYDDDKSAEEREAEEENQ